MKTLSRLVPAAHTRLARIRDASPPLGGRGGARRGFTLIELLVTISIIVLLAALLFPASLKVMESANSAKCAGNLKQLCAAAASYSSDNDGKLVPKCTGTGAPDAVTFRAYLMPYVAGSWNVFICPSDPWGRKQTTSAYAVQHGTTPTSYAINGAFFNFINGRTLPYPGYHDYLPLDASNDGKANKKFSSIPHPMSTIFLCDTGRPDSIAGSPSEWTETQRAVTNASFGYAKMPVSGANSWAGGQDSIYPRHAHGRTNVAFYDGHVASLSIQDDIAAYGPGDPKCLYDYH